MKSLIYSVYRHGEAGLSNLTMSFEVGVILSRLTDRLLVLQGNVTPPANVVHYGEIISNTYKSKITDLMDLGVPWIDAEKLNLNAFSPFELCNYPIWDCVFYFPPWLSTDSEDFRSFAGGRKHFITIDDDVVDIPALSFSGGPGHNTLSFYSYFFYFDQSAQSQAIDALRKMKPKREYSEFALRVAEDLGNFNAVHIRRGDFKKTVGVTTLLREPEEVIAALDGQFGREDRLVVLTDEASDPFFESIKAAFKNYVFLDQHILANYGRDFLDLPAHDSIALAYLSQLVAAESRDFIGSMRSTFTALIQRMRGNGGKEELFKFLWNEQPNPEDALLPGRHRIGDAIRLESGVMIPERDGIYSWNRYHQDLNPAWMREWPESFLKEAALLQRAGSRSVSRRATSASEAERAAANVATPAPTSGNSVRQEDGLEFTLSFLDHRITASSNRADLALAIRNLFEMMVAPCAAQSSCEIRVEVLGNEAEILLDGRPITEITAGSGLLRSFYRQIVCQFIERFPHLVWLHAGAAASSEGAVILPGEWARGKSSLVMELSDRGWLFLSDDVAPLDATKGVVVPFPGTPQIRLDVDNNLRREEIGNVAKSALALDPAKVAGTPQPLAMIVFPYFVIGASPELAPVSRSQAVCKLLENCLSFVKNEDTTIRQLCAAVENLPTYDLRFGNAAEGASLMMQSYDRLSRSGGLRHH